MSKVILLNNATARALLSRTHIHQPSKVSPKGCASKNPNVFQGIARNNKECQGIPAVPREYAK